jgi:hypothetical protein
MTLFKQESVQVNISNETRRAKTSYTSNCHVWPSDTYLEGPGPTLHAVLERVTFRSRDHSILEMEEKQDLF